MKPTRRDLIVGVGAAGAASLVGCRGREARRDTATTAISHPEPAPDRPPEPGPWDPGGNEDPDAFAYGVHAGDPTEDGVLLSVRTAEAGCEIVVVAQHGSGWREVLRQGPLDPDGRAIRFELTGLAPDTAHRYAWFAGDGLRRSAVGRFRTAPGADQAPRKLVIGATSCLGGANPTFPSLAAAAARQLDAMLLLGDTIYADGAVTLDDYRGEWDRQLAKDNVRALCGSTAVVATWDDHEVDNNFVVGGTVTPEQFDDALAAFREAIPMRVGPGGTGLWRTVRFGRIAELFVLDDRGERDWSTRIVSDAQLDAMIEAIHASEAVFKVVLCSVHLTDHSAFMGPVEAMDRWQGYPAQREALVRACDAVPGAFVITGDMHYSGVQRVGAPGDPGEALVEIAAGPAGSELAPFREVLELAQEPLPQYLWMGDTWTVSVLTLDPGTGEVTAEFVDDAGAVIHTHTWVP